MDADRQARYRERKRNEKDIEDGQEKRQENLEKLKQAAEMRQERRHGIMYIGINEKLRRALPKGFCSDERDPYYVLRSFGFDPEEPKFHMWNADLVTKGRGKNKKSVIVVMNAACGFAVMFPFIPIPAVLSSSTCSSITLKSSSEEDLRVIEEQEEQEQQAQEYGQEECEAALEEYRDTVKKTIDKAIYDGFAADYYTADRVAAALSDQIIFVRSNDSFCHRTTELCERIEGIVEKDPMELDQRKLNNSDRKFGNSSFYRSVENETARCLMLTTEEAMDVMKKKHSGWVEAAGEV